MGSSPSMYATVCEAMYFEKQVSGVVTTAGKKKRRRRRHKAKTSATYGSSVTYLLAAAPAEARTLNNA